MSAIEDLKKLGENLDIIIPGLMVMQVRKERSLIIGGEVDDVLVRYLGRRRERLHRFRKARNALLVHAASHEQQG